MTARTQDEILARYREAASDPDDMFGWRREEPRPEWVRSS